jgi:hypothetical protein
MSEGFPGLPPSGAPPRQVAAVVNRLNQGKLSCTGTVTLTPNQTTTVVSDARAGAASVVLLTPLTASAAAEVAAGGLYVSTRSKGAFTLTHGSSAAADRTFGYALLG